MGQAGFIIRTAGVSIGIDLYLSDSLAAKYQGTRFDHTRMAGIPCDAQQLRYLDLLLSTHSHTDHMDQETLRHIYQNPEQGAPLYICPRAELSKAQTKGAAREKTVGLNVQETLIVETNRKGKCAITATRAAHEVVMQDVWHNDHFLGFLMEMEGMHIYHSGDCVPFDGLLSFLQSTEIDVALLPVNGRDAERTEGGIAGNFTVEEACELCKTARIPLLVPHHFGMFAFNTVSVERIRQGLRDSGLKEGESAVIPTIGQVYRLTAVERGFMP